MFSFITNASTRNTMRKNEVVNLRTHEKKKIKKDRKLGRICLKFELITLQILFYPNYYKTLFMFRVLVLCSKKKKK